MTHLAVDSTFKLLKVVGAFGFECGEMFDEGQGELKVELDLFVGGVESYDGRFCDIDEAQHIGEGSAEAYFYPELLQYFD
jgi:hypothetical protein